MARTRATRPPELGGLPAWLTILQARSVVVDALDRDLEEAGQIPLPWFEVLIQLMSAPESRLKMQELAHSVLLSKSGVTRLVDRMVEAGLVARQACPGDRRATHVTATPAGRTALEGALDVHHRSLEKFFTTHLTPAELGMLRTTLRKVLAANGFADPPCPSLLPGEEPVEGIPRRAARH